MTAATSGFSSTAIVAGSWPARQRRPVSSVIVWKTHASALACIRRGDGRGVAVGHLQAQPPDRRADRGQRAEAATDLLRGHRRDPVDERERFVPDRGGRGHPGRPVADELDEPVAQRLVLVQDQVVLGREVVVDGLLGDVRGPGHVSDRHLLVAALGEQPRRGGRDPRPRLLLLTLPQPCRFHAGTIH
jgi:hypothetical protein